MGRGQKAKKAKARDAKKRRATTEALGAEVKSKGKQWKKGPAGA